MRNKHLADLEENESLIYRLKNGDCLHSRIEAAEILEKVQNTKYLIWSVEHNLWWNPKSRGYTTNWKNAGRYSQEEAISICQDDWDGENAAVPDEIPVPEYMIKWIIK